MRFLSGFFRFVVSLLMPVVLIFGGGGLAVFGIEQDWSWLVWLGLIVVGAGILWGVIIFLWADSGSFLD